MIIMEETVNQLKEMRAIEHVTQIVEYVDQIPMLRLQNSTLRGMLGTMVKEYNERYFSQETPKPD